MVSLLSLSAELKLSIIEQLGLTSTSFIPAPSSDVLSLSRVSRVFRTLTLPYLLRDVTLVNIGKSGFSVSLILGSPYAKHVRTLHYIGIMPTAPDPFVEREEAARQPSQDDLPESAKHVLSNLDKFANLERLVVEFRCGKTLSGKRIIKYIEAVTISLKNSTILKRPSKRRRPILSGR